MHIRLTMLRTSHDRNEHMERGQTTPSNGQATGRSSMFCLGIKNEGWKIIFWDLSMPQAGFKGAEM